VIDWDHILGEGAHKATLEKMYADKTLEGMSIHLGIAVNTLRAKMQKEGITFKPRGGLDPKTKMAKSRLDSLPREKFKELSVRDIALMFDMYPSAVYKYMKRKGIELASVPRNDNQDEEAGVSSEDNVGGGELEAEPSGPASGEHTAGKSGATGEVRGGIQSDDVKGSGDVGGQVQGEGQ
jgi:hypothetical protein